MGSTVQSFNFDPNSTAVVATTGTDTISGISSTNQTRGVTANSVVAAQGASPITAYQSLTTLATHVKAPIPLEQLNTQLIAQDFYRNGYNDDSTNPATPVGARTVYDLEEQIVSIRFLSINEQDTSPGATPGSQKQLATPFTHFFLQSITEARQERMQLMETFTSSWIYFFGERTPVYSFSGMLLNSSNFRWANDWMYMYDKAFRGSSSAERKAICQMAYDGKIIEGYIFNTNINRNSQLHMGFPFSFNMVITKDQQVSFSTDFVMQSSSSAQDLKAAQSSPTAGALPVTLPATNIDQIQGALNGGPTAGILNSSQISGLSVG